MNLRAAIRMRSRIFLDAYGTAEGVKKEWDTRGRGKTAVTLSRDEIGTLQEHMNEAIKEGNKQWATALTHAIQQQSVKHSLITPADHEAFVEHFQDLVKEKEFKTADTMWKAFKKQPSSIAGAGQTDSSSFIGRKYRVVDTKYGHPISEHDNPEDAERAMLARPYSKILSEPNPASTPEVRDIARRRLVKTNPDVD